MLLSVEEAENRFEELVELALGGEEILIAYEDRLVQLVPFRPRQFIHGILADKLTGEVPDFLEPMSEEELLDWEGRD
jgi:hypothetical protein